MSGWQMIRLSPGITGIWGRKEGKQGPGVDLEAFRSHCHAAARNSGAMLLTIDDSMQPRSYVTARFQFSDLTVELLLNRIYPVVGFAVPPREGECLFEYRDCPKLEQAFRSFGTYLIATPEELNKPLRVEMCEELNPEEGD